MTARALVACALLLGGCHFGVSGIDVDASAASDAGQDALDANVEFGEPIDANLFDFRVSGDIARRTADGALPRQIGYPCVAADDCDNGMCIDGYCCDELCDPFDPANKCRACNVPGAEGRCVFAQDGTDPRGLCDAEPPSSCGQDGYCDGRGACRMWGAGIICGIAACSNGQVTAPPLCDGNGTCVPGSATANCDPYACAADGNGCAQSCTPSGGCAGTASCDTSGHCVGKLPLGSTCFAPSDCGSGFCEQGVCCSTTCAGGCKSCGLPGAKGFCTNVAAGTDPFGDCAADPRSSCGNDGLCDGNGACEKWPSTTQCAPRTCSGTSTVAPRFCDGSGTCLPGVSVSCVPYACDSWTGVCFGQPCSNDNQCSPGNRCKHQGTCGP